MTTVDLSFLNKGPLEDENTVDLSFLKEDPKKQENIVDLSFLKEEPAQAAPEMPQEEPQSFFDRLGQAIPQLAASSLEEMGIRTDVSPAKQVTDYLLGKSPTQLAYQSAVKKKPAERILAPLRGWLDYFENVSGGIKMPDIESVKRGGPLFAPTPSEAWRTKAEEGLAPEEAEALRKSEFEGMIAIDLLLSGLGGAKVPPKEAVKGKPIPVNPVQRKIGKLDAVLRSGASEGEKAAALAAKERLTGKYNVRKGIEKIASKEGISIPNALRRIWESTKKWGREKFGRTPTATNAKFEEADKFLEYVQTAEEKGLAVIEKIAKPTIKEVPVVGKAMVALPKPPTPPKEPPPPTLPEKPPIQEVMEKDPLSQVLLKDNRVLQVLSNLANKFDIERPFVKAGAPETGFRVKTYHVEINKNVDQGKVVQKEIKKLKLSKEEMGDLVLASELKNPPKDPKLAKAYDISTKYFDDSLAELKKAGVLKGGFIENQVDNIQNEIDQKRADLKKKGITTQQRKNRLVELEDLKNELNKLKDLRFVSIPARLWFESEAIRDPATFKRVLKYQTNKRRKTLRIKDLVDAGVVKKDSLNMNEIIDFYSRKKGRDLALANIINAAKTEGLASLEPKKNFVKIPGYVAPELAKYYVHPAFADYISVYTQPVPMTRYDKLARVSKGYAFYNPMFIPMYDIVQQLPLLLSNLKSLPKMPKLYTQAIRDVIKKTPSYWKAYENGLFSNIFVPESAILKDYASKLPANQNSPGIEIIKKIANMPLKLHNKFYDAVQGLTWGMDQIIRYVSYNMLMNAGLSPRDAAQLAAQFHGDYAKMPPRTRRQLNRFIFTPTFQSLMIRLPFTLAKGGGKVGKAILKGEKVPLKERKGFEGLIGIAAVIAAIDIYLRDKDWKPDVWGYRYTKEDPDTPGKEVVLTVSHPFNVLIKWLDIIGAPFFDKSEDRMFWKVARRLKFRSAIPVQIAWELIENKKRTGAPIVTPGDNPVIKTTKVMDHVAGRIIAIYGDWVKQERIGDPKAQEFLKEDLNKLIANLPLLFTYMRSGEAARVYGKKVAIERKFIAELNRLARQGKTMSEKEMEKWREAIRDVK